MQTNEEKKILDISLLLTICGTAFCIWFIIYGVKNHLFTSQEALESFLMPFGLAAPLIFVAIQMIQVVVPVIPGGISCLAGVLLFGPVAGFIYNYLGICLGSVCAFLISKSVGVRAVGRAAEKKKNQKYFKWLDSGKFELLFAAAIFFPVAPDDLLCYLAGLTKMSLAKFSAIIVLGKPMSIALYSMGLKWAAGQVLPLLG